MNADLVHVEQASDLRRSPSLALWLVAMGAGVIAALLIAVAVLGATQK